MSLLREIQADLTNAEVPLQSILLKGQILASRLGSDELRQWLDCELNGYPGDVELPDYRVLPTESRGHLALPFGGEVKNVPMAKSGMPQEIQDFMSSVQLAHGVGEIHKLVQTSETTLTLPWPPDLIAIMSAHVYRSNNKELVGAVRVISVSALHGVLTAVRSKFLNFVLDIEKTAPNAGEAPPGESPVPPERVSQIFHMNISGGQVVAGSSGFTQTQYVGIQPEDFGSLREFLVQVGLKEEDVGELKEAIEADGGKPSGDKFGTRVAAWVANMVGKAASGVWQISLSAAGQVLGTALQRYYGLI